MFVVGITGGIGAGKTTLMKMFENKNVPCFYADDVAKELMESKIKLKVIQQFGKSICKQDGSIDKSKLSTIVFSNKLQLQKLSDIIHPKVRQAFRKFKKQHHNRWLIAKEAAILIESGTHKECDYIVLVTSPRKIRIQRIMHRNKITSEMVDARMKQQWSDEKKKSYADFIIESIDEQKMKKDFETLYEELKSLAK
ncbi:MAG: dephospho-CoA kinase [Flavobacteriaceae bacterium]|nr:dephospho-CoA kinase [Flavobacteriaceae bacterium]MCY4267888.1 dephospho-CoA kinase [Flavobacteriaceae bacterium]MCY4298795.1 dephospho-CoA kinase [Flavobacteriaceae bacterium]